MTSLPTPEGPAGLPVTNTVKWRFPGVHPEGRKFALIAGGMTLIALWAGGWFWAWPFVGLTIWVAAFFRDPVRVTPQGEGLIVSPADGLVTMIERVPVPQEMAGSQGLGDGSRVRVSVFMSVFDVHINRTPISGTIRQVVYISGKFLNADLDKASEENERQHFVVEGADGTRVGFTQIAGLVARRIMTFTKVGDIVAAGQRIGLIRFGSRVDVYLPEGCEPQVALGQRAIAGETILGRTGVARAVGVAQ
ncbi:phosphatidylserine decarboxylase [Sphingomonas sp.]|uniref:phosphatidylserine decarboxylase n=1 Tax=Sphingomonas sp. TaxID=28214 RepID=UPI002DD671E0|nr:phosphatidylserine decarboxylase [Sphingomonas sp.]